LIDSKHYALRHDVGLLVFGVAFTADQYLTRLFGQCAGRDDANRPELGRLYGAENIGLQRQTLYPSYDSCSQAYGCLLWQLKNRFQPELDAYFGELCPEQSSD
jgi:hypothetical protein